MTTQEHLNNGGQWLSKEQEELIQVACASLDATLSKKQTNTYVKWQIKMMQSKTSLSRNSGLERILEMPEPDGLGKGFML